MKTNAKILSIRKTEAGNFIVAIQQTVMYQESNVNLLGMLNPGEKAFENSQVKPRIAYLNKANREGILTTFGIDVDTLSFVKNDKGHSVAVIDKDCPTIAGKEINIQVTDTIDPKVITEYDRANYKTRAKRINKKDENGVEKPHYFLKDGALVFQYLKVVVGEPKHSRITDAEMTPCEAYETIMQLASTDDNL